MYIANHSFRTTQLLLLICLRFQRKRFVTCFGYHNEAIVTSLIMKWIYFLTNYTWTLIMLVIFFLSKSNYDHKGIDHFLNYLIKHIYNIILRNYNFVRRIEERTIMIIKTSGNYIIERIANSFKFLFQKIKIFKIAIVNL